MLITICVIILVFAGAQALMDILEETSCLTPILVLLSLCLLTVAMVGAENALWSLLRNF